MRMKAPAAVRAANSAVRVRMRVFMGGESFRVFSIVLRRRTAAQ